MGTAFLEVKNRAVSTLAAGINDAVTSLDVAAGEGTLFPSSYPFHITIDDEILSCTNRTTDTLTVVRARQGTVAASHSGGAALALNITAKSVSDLNTAVNAIEDQVAYGRLDGWTVDKLLKGAGAGSDPTEIDVPSGGQTSLLVANSGTDANAGATNVDTVAITGLTALDTIIVYFNLKGISQNIALPTLHNATDNVKIIELYEGSYVQAGYAVVGMATIRQSQDSATSIHAFSMSVRVAAGTFKNDGIDSAFTQDWTGSWILALRHDGVPGGGTLRWSWAVFKVAGQ